VRVFEQTSLFVHANAAPRTIYIRMYMHTHTHTHKLSLSLSLTHTTTHIHTYTCVCVCVCTRREKANEKGMEACLIWHGSMSYLANRWQTVGKPLANRVKFTQLWSCLHRKILDLPTFPRTSWRERERERERGREGGRIHGNSIYERGSRPEVLCLFFI